MILAIAALLLTFFVIAAPLAANAEGAKVMVRVSPDTVYAGERISGTILVQHRLGTTVAVELPDSIALSPFILIGRTNTTKPFSASMTEVRVELELAVFGSGSQQFPAFTLAFFDADGLMIGRQEHRTDAQVIVKTLTSPDMLDFRPLKPPERPGFPFRLLLPILFGMLGLAAAVLLALFLVKRKVRLFAETVDPSQVAGRKLRRLEGRLSSGMQPSECYAELSTIIREYLERHYHIQALEAVTQEIERDLRKLGVSSFETIMTLLRQADLVKFADSRPTADESRNSIRKAGEIVRSSESGGKG
jgi:hypothetical protein